MHLQKTSFLFLALVFILGVNMDKVNSEPAQNTHFQRQKRRSRRSREGA